MVYLTNKCQWLVNVGECLIQFEVFEDFNKELMLKTAKNIKRMFQSKTHLGDHVKHG